MYDQGTQYVLLVLEPQASFFQLPNSSVLLELQRIAGWSECSSAWPPHRVSIQLQLHFLT